MSDGGNSGGNWDDSAPRQAAVDLVNCQLVLESARACQSLAAALERVDVEITDAETRERFVKRMSRMSVLFRYVPSILDPRRIICLADRAAQNPDWWNSNRVHFFCPDMTYNDIANHLDLKPHCVRDYVQSVEIPDSCYDELPEIDKF